MEKISAWAAIQPVWVQVVIGLVVFFIGFPLALNILVAFWVNFLEFIDSSKSTPPMDEKRKAAIEAEENIRRSVKDAALTPIHYILIGLPLLFVVLVVVEYIFR